MVVKATIAESLSVHFDKHMLNFVVLEGESVTQLDGHRVGMGDLEVQLVDKPFALITRNFAAFYPFNIPQMSLIDSIDETCNGG